MNETGIGDGDAQRIRPAAGEAGAGREAEPPFHIDPAARLLTRQRALRDRPRVSIRLRLLASLGLCGLVTALFAVEGLSVLRRVRVSQATLETCRGLREEALHVRARADSGSLVREDVAATLARVEAVVDLLASTRGDRDAAAGAEAFARACREALGARPGEPRATGPGGLDPAAVAALRGAADETYRRLKPLMERETAAVTSGIRRAEKVPLVLLAVLLSLFTVITLAFHQAMAAALARFRSYTSRIAAGDFTFIRPARAYRDEFSDLALAVNEMLAELRAQQNRMVKGAKLAAVGTLTSGIAHEINNPLNNISITTEALMEDLKTLSDEEKWRLLQDIYFETERASEIVKSLLDFTRQDKPEMVPLDLNEVIRSTSRLAQNEMAINNVTLECDVPAELPQIRGSANQLRQVFLNIFLNGSQAMPGGGLLRVTTDVHRRDRVCVEVHDGGVGIDPEALPHIFDPFFTTKEPGKGTGLGLSVSLGIVRKIGGDIQVESEPGRGTTVHVCLPTAAEG